MEGTLVYNNSTKFDVYGSSTRRLGYQGNGSASLTRVTPYTSHLGVPFGFKTGLSTT